MYYQRVTLSGWRDLTRDKVFRADGSVASDTLTVMEPGGVVRFSSTQETELDGLGRVSALCIDGSVLYTLTRPPNRCTKRDRPSPWCAEAALAGGPLSRALAAVPSITLTAKLD